MFDDDSRSMWFLHYKHKGFREQHLCFENPRILLSHAVSHFHELVPGPRPFRRRFEGQFPVHHFGFLVLLGWFLAVLLPLLVLLSFWGAFDVWFCLGSKSRA